MQTNKISLVGADFEVGQSKKGLSESSDLFALHLERFQPQLNLSFEKMGQVKYEIENQSVKCFSEFDFFKLDLTKYEMLSALTLAGIKANGKCLNFGGDHSIAISTIEATLRVSASTHVIWIDAHADLNSAEESQSGHFHGMPVYYLLQQPHARPISMQWMQKRLQPAQLTYIGLRDIDPFELQFLKATGIQYFTAKDVQQLGLDFILNYVREKNKMYDHIHLSFDIDSMDPGYGLCTGVPVTGGLTFEVVEKIFSLVNESGKLLNADFVEINPLLANSKAELSNLYQLAVSLLKTLFQNDKNKYKTNEGDARCFLF